MQVSRILDWLKKHYDKLLAFVILLVLLLSLIYLAVRISTIKGKQKQFQQEIRLTPTFPNAAAIDMAPFEKAIQSMKTPFQIDPTNWTSAMFDPEERAWCESCRGLVSVKDDVCPFCGFAQTEYKEHVKDLDSDNDLIPDTDEKAMGLDPFDARDANLDRDRDLFTNLEEYNAKPRTNIEDPKSHPPYEDYMYLLGIRTLPFKLLFKSYIKLPPEARLKGPGDTDILLPPGTTITIPASSNIKMPNTDVWTAPERAFFRLVDVADFAILQKSVDGKTEKELYPSSFTLFEDTQLDLPVGSVLHVPEKKEVKIGKKVTVYPHSDYKLGFNTRDGTRTHFITRGEKIPGEDLELVKFEIKRENVVNNGFSRNVDKSEATLKKGSKIIELEIHRPNVLQEFLVGIAFEKKPGWRAILHEVGDTFTMMDKNYKLIKIDMGAQSVVIERLLDNKPFTLRVKARMPKAPAPQPKPEPKKSSRVGEEEEAK